MCCPTLSILCLQAICPYVVHPSNSHIIIRRDVGGGGSTGVVREPRHRPLLFVSYRTARIRVSPPQQTGRGSNIRSLWRPRPPMVVKHGHIPRIATHQSQTIVIRCGQHHVCVAAPFHPPQSLYSKEERGGETTAVD